MGSASGQDSMEEVFCSRNTFAASSNRYRFFPSFLYSLNTSFIRQQCFEWILRINSLQQSSASLLQQYKSSICLASGPGFSAFSYKFSIQGISISINLSSTGMNSPPKSIGKTSLLSFRISLARSNKAYLVRSNKAHDPCSHFSTYCWRCCRQASESCVILCTQICRECSLNPQLKQSVTFCCHCFGSCFLGFTRDSSSSLQHSLKVVLKTSGFVSLYILSLFSIKININHCTFRLGIECSTASSQLSLFCTRSRISNTWFTVKIADVFRLTFIGNRLVLIPCSVALLNVISFSRLWSTSPPMMYTSSVLTSSSVTSLSPVKYTSFSGANSSQQLPLSSAIPQFEALLFCKVCTKASVSELTTKFRGASALKLFEWQSSICLYSDVFSFSVIWLRNCRSITAVGPAFIASLYCSFVLLAGCYLSCSEGCGFAGGSAPLRFSFQICFFNSFFALNFSFSLSYFAAFFTCFLDSACLGCSSSPTTQSIYLFMPVIVYVKHQDAERPLELATLDWEPFEELVKQQFSLEGTFSIQNAEGEKVTEILEGGHYVVSVSSLEKLKNFIMEAPGKIKDKTLRRTKRKLSLHNQPDEPQDLKEKSITQYNNDTTFAEQAILKKVEKRKQIAQRIEEERGERDRFRQMQLEGNRVIRQIQERMKQKEQLIKQKEELIVLPELEKRKQVLAQKRELSQPIRLDQLAEHQRRYEEEKKIKDMERELHKQELEQEFKQKAHKFPKSQAQLRLEEQQKQLRLLKQQEQEEKLLKRQRQLKYADVAQELYFKEHPKKQREVTPQKEEMIMKLNETNIKKLQKALGQLPRHQSQDSKESVEMKSFHQENRPPRPKLTKKPESKPEKVVAELPPKPKTTDYLQQFKQSRKQRVPLEEQWEKIIENKQMEHEKKFQNVLSNVQKMEQKAKEREKLAQLNQDQDAEEEANNLYIASIKAKLALLEQN